MSRRITNTFHAQLTLANTQAAGDYTLIRNSSKGKTVYVKTVGSIETGEHFSAKVEEGPGKIYVESDLTGLKNVKPAK